MQIGDKVIVKIPYALGWYDAIIESEMDTDGRFSVRYEGEPGGIFKNNLLRLLPKDIKPIKSIQSVHRVAGDNQNNHQRQT